MARPLPTSLSPHICVSASPDVQELFTTHDLPPLSLILQSFTPLSQVNTRTTTLTTVSHSAFHLRFSDLTEIERSCKEDPARRAVRAIDWVSERITRNCSSWLGAVEGGDLPTSSSTRGEDAGKGSGIRIVSESPNTAPVSWRTPWWDEIRKCAEGERVPSRTEGWNHPVAVVVAVSTTIPNPLQAASNLHARPSELPGWVDPTHFRYTVVIHPEGDSLLSDDETVALFNGIRKQFGLNTYLLRLSLPKDSQAPVQMASPAMLPELPPEGVDDEDGASRSSTQNPTATQIAAVALDRKDAREIDQFVREFVAQGLVPWMERAVSEWNETYSSSRRLPSRLFSSTRRLFGTGYSSSPAPPPTHHRSSTLNQSSPQAFGSASGGPNNVGAGSGIISEQRRLAEFATVLGDYKLATYVWETLRKDGKGGSEILPLLLAPAPGVQLHAQFALQSLFSVQQQSGGTSPHVLWNTLRYVARWEEGIPVEDFTGDMLEGDRWLFWAAGNAEDPPAALLLAQSAHLSAIKLSKRKASLLYLMAANRLEKSGIKPLTMYFLRRAQALYTFKAEKDLSPSFWDANGRTPENWQGFEGIRPGIDAALARLLYTSGNLEEAVSIYLRLLEPLPLGPRHILPDGRDQALIEAQHRGQILLGDFDVAFKHLSSSPEGRERLGGLKLPFNLCIPQESRIRSPRQSLDAGEDLWLSREDAWKTYWKKQGSEQLLNSGKVAVGETFWLDVMMINPLHVEVNITNFTANVEDVAGSNGGAGDLVDIEVLSDIVLHPLEKRTVPLAVIAKSTGTFTFTELTFEFMSILPTSQPLKSRGPRLHATPLQRQQKMYGPDVRISVQVEDAQLRLGAYFVDDGHLSLFEGERKLVQMFISNEGTQDVGEVFLVPGDQEEILLSQQVTATDLLLPGSNEVILPSENCISSKGPLRLPLELGHESAALAAKEHVTVTVLMRAGPPVRDGQLSWLLVYRSGEGDAFHSIRMTRSYDVSPLLDTNILTNPSQAHNHMYSLNLQLANISAAYDVNIVQVMAISPHWKVTCDASEEIQIPVDQGATRFFSADPWSRESPDTGVYNFVKDQITRVVQGLLPEPIIPPALDLLCSFTMPSHNDRTDTEYALLANSIHQSAASTMRRSLATAHPHIPSELHRSIFPVWHPAALHLVLSWEMPSESRYGHVIVPVGELGAGHASLSTALSEQRETTAKRSMYAETQTERQEVLRALEDSVWNREMNPIAVAIQNTHVRHDFSQGPCYPVATFVIRNFSLTHASRFVLKLHDKPQEGPDEHVDVPRYVGRRTFRGELQPHGSIEVSPKLWVDRAGSYQLSGWSVETEVGEMSGGADESPAWSTLFRYQQSCGGEGRASLVVTDVT